VGLLPYQRAAVSSEARFTWNCWARQTGKSFTFSLRRVLRGLERRRNQIILSAGERQSREVMEKVRRHCQALKVWSEWHGQGFYRDTSFRQLEVRLPGGVRIIGLPANPMTARGFTGDVFLDEFAMHADDGEIWSALFPTLLRGEGELDVASTPRGRKNVFYRLRENERFGHQRVSLEDAVSQGLDVDTVAMREGLADELAWRQEFCCEFVDESTSFMTHELIKQCHDPRLGVPVDWSCLGRPGAAVYVGVDVGRYRDVTAIWLWERQGEEFMTRGVEVLAAAPFGEQESVIGRILQQRGVRRCCIDATGLGLQLAERLAERFGEHRVEGVTFTRGLKSELAGGLRVLAERGLLRIPADVTIANDWHSIARIVTGGGHVRFDADRSSGGHADRFWAAALGIHAADELVGGAELVTSGRLTFAREGVW
jgi:phage FluMu gp28-like protein